MTVRRGKIHEYLGMTLDFSQPKKFIIGMENYIDNVLQELPDDMAGVATTPAAEHLFRTRDNAPKLDDIKKELFHKVTAQLLYACKRGRPDVHTAIAFAELSSCASPWRPPILTRITGSLMVHSPCTTTCEATRGLI